MLFTVKAGEREVKLMKEKKSQDPAVFPIIKRKIQHHDRNSFLHSEVHLLSAFIPVLCCYLLSEGLIKASP
jgi:hypothetical protein